MKKEADWSQERTGLTEGQKKWVRRAYEAYYGGVYCLYPKLVGHKGGVDIVDVCGSDDHTNIHHITPQGYSKRILNEDPDYPENLIPICQRHHTGGDPNKALTREAQEVCHLDSVSAKRKYRPGEKPSSFERVSEQRKRVTDRGQKYWVDFFDNYFYLISFEVMEWYLSNSDDPWPTRRR